MSDKKQGDKREFPSWALPPPPPPPPPVPPSGTPQRPICVYTMLGTGICDNCRCYRNTYTQISRQDMSRSLSEKGLPPTTLLDLPRTWYLREHDPWERTWRQAEFASLVERKGPKL